MLSRISAGGLYVDELPSNGVTFTCTDHRHLGIIECLVLIGEGDSSVVISEIDIWEEYYA